MCWFPNVLSIHLFVTFLLLGYMPLFKVGKRSPEYSSHPEYSLGIPTVFRVKVERFSYFLVNILPV